MPQPLLKGEAGSQRLRSEIVDELERIARSDFGIQVATALRALDGHPGIPALLGTTERDGTLTLLIQGIDGAPWVNVGDDPPELLQGLGRSMARMH